MVLPMAVPLSCQRHRQGPGLLALCSGPSWSPGLAALALPVARQENHPAAKPWSEHAAVWLLSGSCGFASLSCVFAFSMEAVLPKGLDVCPGLAMNWWKPRQLCLYFSKRLCGLFLVLLTMRLFWKRRRMKVAGGQSPASACWGVTGMWRDPQFPRNLMWFLYVLKQISGELPRWRHVPLSSAQKSARSLEMRSGEKLESFFLWRREIKISSCS